MKVPTVVCEINFAKARDESHPARLLLIQENAEIILDSGEPFKFTPAFLKKTAENSNKRHNHDIVLDYNHNTYESSGNIESKQAAGWIKKGTFEYLEGLGLLAEVVLTDTAKELVESRKFRFVSPVLPLPLDDKAYIVNAALTNNPRINFSIDPIMAMEMGIVQDRGSKNEKEVHSMSRITKLLGLADTATEEQILESLAAIQGASTTAKTLVEQTAVLLNCKPAELEKRIPDLVKQVQETQKNAERIVQLENEKKEAAISGALDTAQREGKITKAEREKWTGYLRKGAEFFEILAALPAKVDLQQRGRNVNTDTEATKDGATLSFYEAEKLALNDCYDVEVGDGAVDFLRFDLHYQAKQLMEKNPKLSYREALVLVEKSGILDQKGAMA